MRIRLYINRTDHPHPPGLYYGRHKDTRIRVSDDIWSNSTNFGGEGWTPIWHLFYDRDHASPGVPWYSIDINKFVILT